MGSPAHSRWVIVVELGLVPPCAAISRGLLRSEAGYAGRVVDFLVDALMTLTRLVCKYTLRTYG